MRCQFVSLQDPVFFSSWMSFFFVVRWHESAHSGFLNHFPLLSSVALLLRQHQQRELTGQIHQNDLNECLFVVYLYKF